MMFLYQNVLRKLLLKETNKGFKGTVVNQALQYLHVGSLEI